MIKKIYTYHTDEEMKSTDMIWARNFFLFFVSFTFIMGVIIGIQIGEYIK